MATYNIHAGHNFYTPGAVGYFSETEQDRIVKNKVIELLRNEGHTVYDCTDEDGRSESQNLANIVTLQNSHVVDLDVSIHFNAYNWSAYGVEVLQFSSRTQAVAERILKNIVDLGFKNRGVKDGSSLCVLRKSNCPAILIECCFCDSDIDNGIYNADKMAIAIVKGILNKSSISNITTTTPIQTPSTKDELYRVRKSWNDIKSQIGAYRILDNAKQACPEGYSVFDSNGNVVYSKDVIKQDELYRVRKSWNDAKSQIGAYKILDNAKQACIAGYSVFDSNGNVVYSVAESTNTVSDNLYRVRTSWDDEKSQIGAYRNIDNAKQACVDGYHVFDSNGNVVYSPVIESEDTVSDDKNMQDNEIKTLNNLADMDTSEFIQYIGDLAKNISEYKILPSIVIAQAILESGWGKSELASKANNLFGMKKSLSGDNWGSEWKGKIYAKTTNEEVDGKVIQVYADFRAYDSIEECIKDHNKYLACAKNGESLRYDGILEETDYYNAANILVDGGYATNSKYADELCRIIKQYKLDVFDCVYDASELETLKEENEELKKENTEMKSLLGTILESLESIIKAIKSILKK